MYGYAAPLATDRRTKCLVTIRRQFLWFHPEVSTEEEDGLSSPFCFIFTFISKQNITFYKPICSYRRYDVPVQLAWSGAHPVTLPESIHVVHLLARPSPVIVRL